MKYIYDILLNFNETKIYDFYEWYQDDDIEYFKKVPLIKTSSEIFKSITIGCTIDDSILMDSMYNATEVYDNKKIRRLEYVCIFADGSEAIAVMLNKSGQVIMMSKMLVDEEEEAIEIGDTLAEKVINVISLDQANTNISNFLTRFESKKLFFLNKELDDLYLNKNLVKLKYLYYECSHQIEGDIDIVYKNIKLFLHDDWTNKHDSLYNLVRLSYSKK